MKLTKKKQHSAAAGETKTIHEITLTQFPSFRVFSWNVIAEEEIDRV